MSAQQQKIRRIVWTGAIAAVTATGAWYGAGLKTQQEVQQARKKVFELSNEEKITQLEEHRASLVTKMNGLERKLAEVEKRLGGATREESMVGRERRFK